MTSEPTSSSSSPLSAISAYVNAVSDGVLVADSDRRILFTNEWVHEATGYTPEELAGAPISLLIPDEDRDQYEAFSQRYSQVPDKREVTGDREVRWRRKDGSAFGVDVILTPVTFGETVLIVATVRNADDRRAVERGLRRQVERQELIAGLSADINDGRPLDEVYEKLAAGLKPLLLFDRFVVTRRVDETHVRTDFISGQHFEGMGVGRIGFAAFRVQRPEMRDIGGVLVADTEAGPSESDPVWLMFHNAGYKSWMEVPLGTAEQPDGYMSVRSKSKDAYDDEAASFFLSVGRQLGPAIRNAELVSRLRRKFDEQELISELSSEINAGAPLEEVYARLAKGLRDFIPYERFVISRHIDPENVRTEFVAGEEFEGMDAGRIGIPVYHAVGAAFITKVNGVLIADTEFDPGDKDRNWDIFSKAGYKSWMEVQLGNIESPDGYLSIRSRMRDAYDHEAIDLFLRIGRQLGPAIRNADLARSLAERAAQQAAIAEIGRTVSSDLDLDQVWDDFVRHLRGIVPADRIVLTQYDRARDVISDTHVWGVEVGGWGKGAEHPASGARSAHVIRTGKAAFDDMLDGHASNARSHTAAGLISGMYAPLFNRGEVTGTLNVKSKSPGIYTQSHLELLQMLADQIAGAVESARLHAVLLDAARAREEQVRLEAHAEVLRKESEFKSTLISTVSHELRTPLTGIISMADILRRNKDKNLSDRQIQQIQVIRGSGRLLYLLTNDLLAASTMEAGMLQLRKSEVDLAEMFDTLSRSLAALFEEKDQDLRLECDQGARVVADPFRLEQIISNLLSNASKYSPEGKTITLSAGCAEEGVTIAVADEGAGIAPENMERLFSTYFRSNDQATNAAKGTGLGLYIVKTLAEAHGGRVRVESEVGAGSRFIVELPGQDDSNSQVTEAA
jgi:PAS domain S-box-containing protein